MRVNPYDAKNLFNYAKKDLKIKLDEDLEYYYNYNRWRLKVCKWVYSPNKHCDRYLNKVKDLVREVGYIQMMRG